MVGLVDDCETDTVEAARGSVPSPPDTESRADRADFVDLVLDELLPGGLPLALPLALPFFRRALVSILGASSSVSQLH